MTASAFVSFRFFCQFLTVYPTWPWGADGFDPTGGIVNGSTAALVVFIVVGVESTISEYSCYQSDIVI